MAIFRREVGTPPNGGIDAGGMKKIAIFDQYLALSRKLYKIELCLQWRTSRKSLVYRTEPFSMTANSAINRMVCNKWVTKRSWTRTLVLTFGTGLCFDRNTV